MPAVVAIAPVLIALLLLLVWYGAKQLGQLFARMVPDWSIPGFDSIRNFVVGEIDAAVRWFQRLIADQLAHAIDFLQVTVNVPRMIFNDLVGVGEETYNALRWVIKKAIPAATYAVQVWTINKIVGLASELYRAIAAARAYAETLVHDAQIWTLQKIAGLARELYDAIAAARAYTETLVHDAQIWTLQKIAGLASEVYATIARLSTWTLTEITSVRADLAAAFRIAEADIATAVTDTEAFAVKTAESTAAAAVGVLTTDIEHAIAQTWVGITDEVKALEGVLATDLPDIRAALDAIPGELADSIPGILTATGALSIPMLRYLRECGIPNCKNLGGYGHFLHDLLGLMGDGAILALVVDLVEHPQSAAHEVVDTLGGLATEIVTETRQLVGV